VTARLPLDRASDAGRSRRRKVTARLPSSEQGINGGNRSLVQGYHAFEISRRPFGWTQNECLVSVRWFLVISLWMKKLF
jgi:hypothetical protein